MKTLSITLIKSLITTTPKQRATVKALGLTKRNQTVERNDTQTTRGMIRTVAHLVDVVEK